MRLAKLSRILLMLALAPVLATCAFAQATVNPNAVRNQLMKPAAGPSQPQTAPQKPAAKAPPSGTKPTAAAAKPPVEKAADEKVTRRDPFETLLNKARAGDAPPENLPPGKAGLLVSALRISGIVKGSNGMIAIVSNGQQRVYFLREGDKLYDGGVDKITLDSISFHEFGKDAFGKPLEHQVTKRIYPSPGEQQ